METEVIAYVKQKSLFDRLDVLANNVANANTNGFKSDLSVYLKDNSVVNGKVVPTPMMTTASDMQAGPLNATGRPLDVAIDGNGFFEVDTPLGPRFTRAGSFTLNAEGQIVTPEGYAVQGDGGAINMDPNDTEILIAGNGEITALNNDLRVSRGTIGIVNFADQSQLRKVGNTYFASPQGPETADPTTFKISQGTVENSNVNSVYQLTELIDVSRDVQQIAKIINDQHSLVRNAVSRIAGTQ